ncbi:hypothetical protein ACH4SP_04550 [Streptomyces sp. NPDC021093]|uniref:hypothetical protein n=1 Tax=Streptomyces sp. NPDC021093 TaxID=3365112 RepID=UPI0037B59652
MTAATIVGGVIAGLACAPSLHAAGFRPQVREAARTIEAVGVGIDRRRTPYAIASGRTASAPACCSSVRTGLLFQRAEQSPDGVRAHFLVRAGGMPVAEDADVLIGSDGIDSAVRARLYPSEGSAHGNGILMWRASAPHPHLLDGSRIRRSGASARRRPLRAWRAGICRGST